MASAESIVILNNMIVHMQMNGDFRDKEGELDLIAE